MDMGMRIQTVAPTDFLSELKTLILLSALQVCKSCWLASMAGATNTTAENTVCGWAHEHDTIVWSKTCCKARQRQYENQPNVSGHQDRRQLSVKRPQRASGTSPQLKREDCESLRSFLINQEQVWPFKSALTHFFRYTRQQLMITCLLKKRSWFQSHLHPYQSFSACGSVDTFAY